MANYNKPTAKKNDNSKTYKTAGLVILVLLVIALALLLFRSCGTTSRRRRCLFVISCVPVLSRSGYRPT